MNQSDWEKAKTLMLPYDGAASQIYLLSLPKTELNHALLEISRLTIDPIVTLISNEPLETNISLLENSFEKSEMKKFMIGQSTISAKLFETADITFDIWTEEVRDTFDLEIWFWADQFFPCEEAQNLERFKFLLSILKNIVKNGACTCILTPCEASDPVKDLENGFGIEIQLKNA